MNGLRMYIKAGTGAAVDSELFYSRRGNGPYYCWLYEQNLCKWRVSRVTAPDFNSHSLSVATWKTVPATLQSRVTDHYLD